MIELIKKAILTFFLVVAGVTICTTVFITIFIPEISFSIFLLWEIIIMAFVCSLGNFIFYSRYEISKSQMKVRIICHYLFINVVVFTGAFLWKWVTPGIILEVLVMLVMIALVYSGVMMFNLKAEEKTAEDLNVRLSRINSGEED